MAEGYFPPAPSVGFHTLHDGGIVGSNANYGSGTYAGWSIGQSIAVGMGMDMGRYSWKQ